MRLYIGSSQQFITDAVHNQVADKLRQAFVNYYRYSPSQAEVRAWRESLRSVSQVFKHNGLLDHGIILEYQIPFTSKRLDCLITGTDERREDNAVIIELKQWETCAHADGVNEVTTFIAGAPREVLHPSAQVGQYATYLQDVHTAFYEPPRPVKLSACAYLHNYRFVPDEILLSEKFSSLTTDYPLFSMDDVDALSEFLKTRLLGGRGMDVLRRIEDGRYRPSRKLMDHVANVIKGNPTYVLLDEQLVAYDRVMASARQGIGEGKKTVIIIKGGPGTGKSVIAINLMADLLLEGYNAHYATGSKAFTETLRRVIGTRGSVQFRYFNSYASAAPEAVDVLICDEAHRIRESSQDRFTPKSRRSGMAQIQELINASRISVFLIDDDQVVRPGEIGSVRFIKEFARKNNCRLFEHELETQFRCSGSEAFVSWVNNTLGIVRTAHVLWTGEESFDFRIFDSPESLEKAIREKARLDYSARMTAGFCWEWSKSSASQPLKDDVVIGEYKRPWNARHEAVNLPRGVPKAQFWAHDPNGMDQIGCVYTAQGFEFDYVGVIFGNDITYSFEQGSWIGHPENSKDSVVRGAKAKFVDLVKNTYRVLLSRGLKGCYVYFLDRDTEKFFRSRMDVAAAAHYQAREDDIEPYINALPFFDIDELGKMGQAELRARLEGSGKQGFLKVPGGPFLRDRFLVRAKDSSMEPLIQNGAICEFRIPGEESQKNGVVLAELSTYSKDTPNLVIRNYQRTLMMRPGEVAESPRILLVPENKEFPPIELREGVDRLDILGLLNRVID
jgi:hypothetical protein